MIIRPYAIPAFGKHKGFSFIKIYKYDPTYIEWLIEFVPEFEIDVDDFAKLPKPTVYYDVYKLELNGTVLEFPRTSLDNASVQDIIDSNKLKEIDFSFSEKTLDILVSKAKDNYVCPEWQRKMYGPVFSIDDIIIPDDKPNGGK